MSSGLINIMKQAAIDAVENGKPCDVRYGTVTSEKPLRVQVTANFVIPESLLTVPQHLTDYKVNVSFDWNTEDTGGHTHEVSSERTKTMTINNALKVGDRVALLRLQGGHSYLVIDKLPK